jgi:hypothetical protein
MISDRKEIILRVCLLATEVLATGGSSDSVTSDNTFADDYTVGCGDGREGETGYGNEIEHFEGVAVTNK